MAIRFGRKKGLREQRGRPQDVFASSGYDYIREEAARLRAMDKEAEKRRRLLARQLRREERARARKEYFAAHRGVVAAGIAFLIALVVLAAAALYVWVSYRVTKVYVDGSTHYTNEEISEMVMTGPLEQNSLYLSFKYRNKGIEGIPFIERMDVTIVDPNTIRISVYEKALAGYVNYLGNYMYFDRNGTVVEASREKTEGIPEVTGLAFDHIVLYEKLPVENDAVFARILNVTQLLGKYELSADRIYFDESENMTLFFGEVRVQMGGDTYADEKISNLKQILPSLEGRSGVLDLQSYTPDSNYITFTEK
ncbi:MAG: cell division protein FtsQ/DivIB [Eubacteriales bacterium]|nr:cell division protein FtsQ/DivIB [Eubacteriales bacterium]